MKTLLFPLLLLVSNNILSQTFTNSTVLANGWGGAGSFTRTINVSGLPATLSAAGTVLRQINFDMGDGSTNYSWFRITATLTSPSGTVINIGTGSGTLSTQDFGQTGAGRNQAKYRDHSQLYTIGEYASLPIGSSLDGWPYHLGYYRVKTAGSFANFNSSNPNGNWTLTVSHNAGTSPSNKPQFNSIQLVFGAPFVINNVTASSAYDACLNAQCLQTNEIVIGDDIGFLDPGPATDPATTQNGCAWNTQINNTSWYKFVATGTSATVTVSAYSNMHQIIGVANTGTCAAPTYSTVSGGCPIGQINYSVGAAPSYDNGSGTGYNHSLSMTGLNPGQTYYVVIDGTGISGSGNQSRYYIELVGGDPCTVLPIELIDFKGESSKNYNHLWWSTASEINNSHFIVEKSEDAFNFMEVARINGSGNSNQMHTYHWNDDMLGTSTLNYYRLKQVDFDGQFKYFDIIALENDSNPKNGISILTNPAIDELIFYRAIEKESSFVIFNAMGLIVQKGILQTGNSILINNLASGMYFIQIENKTLKFVKE